MSWTMYRLQIIYVHWNGNLVSELIFGDFEYTTTSVYGISFPKLNPILLPIGVTRTQV